MSRYISRRVLLLTLTVVICGGLYPLPLRVIGQAIFPFQANSSMLNAPDGKVVGSRAGFTEIEPDARFYGGRVAGGPGSVAEQDCLESAGGYRSTGGYFGSRFSGEAAECSRGCDGELYSRVASEG